MGRGISTSAVARVIRSALGQEDGRKTGSCPSCGRVLLPLPDLVGRARQVVSRVAVADRIAQETALRAAVRLLVEGLRCHLGRCETSRQSGTSLREGSAPCARCGNPALSIAGVQRRLSRTLRSLETEPAEGGLAVLMLDTALMRALSALDCRLGMCRAGP